MATSIQAPIERAREVQMTEPQKVEQRISFAYGTTKIENDTITREMVAAAAKATKNWDMADRKSEAEIPPLIKDTIELAEREA